MNWARVRGIIFLVGFIPAIVSLALVVVKAAVASPGFCMAVLKGAHEADKKIFPNGPPLVTLLVRAFLVRDTTDMEAMELQIIDFDKKIAQNERDRLKKEFETAEANAKSTEERFVAQSELVGKKSQEEEFMRQYRQTVDRVVEIEGDTAQDLS